MSRKRNSPAQIIAKLREAEVALSQGLNVGQACRQLGITRQSDYFSSQESIGMIRFMESPYYRLKLQNKDFMSALQERFPW